jgi:methylenetetrahydrofolate dehydrogenase (NADP+)/methenyltetrahydrofolate cyclohydrolase
MTAKLIDGKAIAQTLRTQIRAEVDKLSAAGRRVPGLAVVIVGEDPASQIYVRNKHKSTEEAGMKSVLRVLPATASQDEVLAIVRELNSDPTIDGILVQLPVPKQIDSKAVIDAIAKGRVHVDRTAGPRPRVRIAAPGIVAPDIAAADIVAPGTPDLGA